MWIRDKDNDKGNLGRVIIWIRGKDKDKDKDEGNLGRFVIMVVMLVMVIVMLVVMIMLAFEDDDRTNGDLFGKQQLRLELWVDQVQHV